MRWLVYKMRRSCKMLTSPLARLLNILRAVYSYIYYPDRPV